ncbi:uncharacterized protein LOC135493702 [Lineus longissimus]|uniref:uncharacterized protein LOC135493702 n=1 Tax=Lineus longissimus TaxID=88925 RepID=UPI002B4F9553
MNVAFIYFVNVIIDWYILKPDLRSQSVNSVLVCAFMCHQQKCTTFNVLLDDNHIICQMSKRKGTCMEKTDASPYPGFRMYQVKDRKKFFYRLTKRLPFIPSFNPQKGWTYDENSGKMSLMKTISEMSPERVIVVYELSTTCYKILYSANFNIGHLKRFSVFKQFMVLGCATGVKLTKLLHHIFDPAKGSICGQIIIPKSDACFMALSVVTFGCQGKVLVHCKVRGRIAATVYDIKELNQTRNVLVVMENGIKVSLRGFIVTMCEDIYLLEQRGKIMYIISYFKSKVYQPAKYPIKSEWSSQIRGLQLKFNRVYELLFAVGRPGPRVFGLRHSHRINGIKREPDELEYRYREVQVSFSPSQFVIDHNNLNLNPTDGSFLHFIQSSSNKPGITVLYHSVDIYSAEF